jgi:hypothetical protein
MRKSFTFLASIFVVVLCMSFSAFAQRTTGDIQGKVTDANGAIVPGASVTVTGKDVGFNRTVTADDQGVYRVNQIPPGNYTVSVAAVSGFVAQTKDNVQVSINNTTTMDFVMGTSTNVVVDVTGEGVLVDPTETKAQDNISAREIDALPMGTGFTSLLRTTASVRPEPLSGQFSINGSTGPENSFLLDGQEVQNYKNGLLNTNNDIPYQALQEIQVKTSGFEAEYGGATGGVISGVTKSGSNDFHGEFGVNFSTPKFNAGPRPVAVNQLITSLNDTGQYFEYFHQNRDGGTNFYPTAVFSGPIVKNKLWFFGIHSPRYVNTTRTTNYVTTGVVAGVRGPHLPSPLNAGLIAAGATPTQTAKERTAYEYSSFRLDASPINSLRVFSSFTWNPISDHGALLGGTYVIGNPTLDGFFGLQGSELAKIAGGRQNSNNFRVEGNWTPLSNFIVNARYTRGFQNQKLGSYGIAAQPRIICQSVPAASQGQAGCIQGFSSVRTNDLIVRDVSLRTTIDANVTYLVNSFGGRHEFKGGWQKSDITNDVLTGNPGTGGRTYLYYGGAFAAPFNPNTTYVQWQIQPFPGSPNGVWPAPTLAPGASIIGTGVTYQFGASGKATNTATTLFIQDKWQPTSRLTFNLGVRAEKELIPHFNDNAIDLKWGFGDKIAPRLGVAYALTGDGKTKISAFYGRFFDRLKFSLPQGSFGGQFYHVSYFYITSDRPGYQNYTVAQLQGNYNFPNGAVCPINGGTASGGTAYVCDQDYRIASNIVGADVLTNGAVDPNVKPYRQSEATVEFQREVMRGSILTARFLWRNLDQVIEDAGIPTAAGEAYVIGNPGQGLAAELYQQLGYNKAPKAKRNYKALQLEYDTRFIKNLSLNLNYTLSRLWGNYSGLAGPDELTAAGGSRNDPNVLRDFDEPWVGFTASGQQAIGILPLDRTHVFKASGTYTFDWWNSHTNSTDVSFFTTAQSGTPLTTFINIFGIPIPETKRGDLGRSPMFTQTDLNFTHRYRFGRDDRFTLAADLNFINVFNENNWLAVNQNKHSGYFALSEGDVSPTGDIVEAVNILTSNGVLTQYAAAEEAFDIGFARNAGFNRPIAFQEPRSVRFGFRLIF